MGISICYKCGAQWTTLLSGENQTYPCKDCAGSKRCKCGNWTDNWQKKCNTCLDAIRDTGIDPSSRYVTQAGYAKVLCPEHHRANAKGYVLEHILVMEEMIGRRLTDDETVHHKNGVRYDNRPENLELWASNHPSGQRVTDLVAWAKAILEKYGDFDD